MSDSEEMRIARAVCGAFLIVAFGDGRFDKVEEMRFLGGATNHEAFAAIESADLQRAYNTLIAELKDDYESASAQILDDIRACRNNNAATEAVKVAARIAIVADPEIQPQEEIVLDQIAGALGLDEGVL